MSIKVTGTVELQEFGPGTWALISDDGTTYELYESPSELHQSGLKVTVEGTVRDDVMTLAMIGPVLQVNSFEVLS